MRLLYKVVEPIDCNLSSVRYELILHYVQREH